MFSAFIHLFLPHHTNNHRPHILHPQGLSVLVGIFLFAHASINLFAQVRGNVLGYASSITPESVLSLINARRTEHQLSSLTLNSQLTQAALMKAADMFTFNYWAHTNPQGKEPWDFIKAAGYRYQFAGENLARDFGDTDSLVEAWLASPTHRENILNPRYQETGIAVVNGTLQGIETTLVVHFFGTPAKATAISAVTSQPPPELTSQAVLAASPPAPAQFFLPPLLLEKTLAASIVILLRRAGP